MKIKSTEIDDTFAEAFKMFGSRIIITAETKDKIVMGVMHKKYNVHGVQFHPESIKTPEGMKLLKNFLNY